MHNETGRLKRDVWCAMRDLVAPQAVEVVGPAREEETSRFAVHVPYLYGINTQNNGAASNRFAMFIPLGIVR